MAAMIAIVRPGPRSGPVTRSGVGWPAALTHPRSIRFLRISAAKIGPIRFHQNRIVSWLTSIPRS